MFKLIYFDLKGRAEPIRFIFALKKIPFEDVRIDQSVWPEYKKTFRWEQVPALEVEGKGVLLQSGAITRYLAKLYDLTGADEFEAARCDEYEGAWNDLKPEWKKYWFEADVEKKATLKKTLLEVHFPAYFSKFEAIKKDNGGDFLVGQRLTWIDILFATGFELYQDTVDKDFLKAYPALLQLQKTVFNIPEIKNWIQQRPKTAL